MSIQSHGTAYIARPTFERRKTLGHMRSINPNMIIINLANHRAANLWKSKFLIAQLETTAWQYLLPCGFFCDAWERFVKNV